MPKEMVGSDEVSTVDRGLEHLREAKEFVLEAIDRITLPTGEDLTILWGKVNGVFRAITTTIPPELFPSPDNDDGPPDSFLQSLRQGPLAIVGKLAAAFASSVAVAACNAPITPQHDNDDQPRFATATLALTAADMDH